MSDETIHFHAASDDLLVVYVGSKKIGEIQSNGFRWVNINFWGKPFMPPIDIDEIIQNAILTGMSTWIVVP